MKQGDKLILGVVMVFVVVTAVLYLTPKQEASYVEVIKQDTVIATLPLDKNILYPVIEGTMENVVEVKDGVAAMESANCGDLVCVRSAPIDKNGSTIVCLPHGLILKTVSNKQSDLDAIAG